MNTNVKGKKSRTRITYHLYTTGKGPYTTPTHTQHINTHKHTQKKRKEQRKRERKLKKTTEHQDKHFLRESN